MVLPHDPFVPTPDSPEWADPLEENPVSSLSDLEEKIKEKFEALIQEKENEIPFEMNDTEFKIQ